MKTKSFQDLLEKRLTKEEIAEIKSQAHLEARYLRSLQNMVSETIDHYMKKNKIGFNELVRQLAWSPSKVAKVQRGEANLTIASLAHLFALLDVNPSAVFKSKK